MMRIALLEYFVHHEGVLLLVLTPDTAEPVLATAEPTLTAEVVRDRVTRLLVDVHGLPHRWDTGETRHRYHRALALPPAVNAAKRSGPVRQRKLRHPAFHYTTEYLNDLGTRLLPASVRPLLETCDVLCIVPHGPLHSIPFAALPWDADCYVGERFGLSQVPSASLLPLLQDRNLARLGRPQRGRRCLAATVAATEDTDPHEFEADADVLSSVLAEAGGSTARLVGASGPRAASKTAVIDAAPEHDIVHLACHGVFVESAADPMEASGLLLSDGSQMPSLAPFLGAEAVPARAKAHLLSARDVLGLSLNAELVTLRACSSGRTAVASGDELLGLVRAFLHAGTPSLLASLWNVNKASSRLLLSHFYRSWLTGAPTPKWWALQQAQRLLRRSAEYDHPFHWAPFVLIGDWL